MTRVLCGCLLQEGLEILICPVATDLELARRVTLGVLMVAPWSGHRAAYARWREAEHRYAAHFAEALGEAA